MAILNRTAIESMGFASVGDNIRISDRASFYNCPHISIGNNTRIDDFCVVSAGAGGITIGDYVHIAVYSSLIGSGIITLSNFCNISSRVAIYSSSDDYSGEAMTNPMVPELYTQVLHADVFLGKHVIVGSGSVILPGVRIEEGAAIGALSLVREDCRTFGVYAGAPAKFIKNRKKDLLDLETKFLKTICPD
ncbi:MAG: acyltransferase [Rhodoferax sp.]|nr:acyltransferase [Rhodoferax sp.]MDP3650142.1 acyltransferase [Rhodoferax sp.]